MRGGSPSHIGGPEEPPPRKFWEIVVPEKRF